MTDVPKGELVERGRNEATKKMTLAERYYSGYSHGLKDRGIDNPKFRYMNQEDTGPSKHTDEFLLGYYMAFYHILPMHQLLAWTHDHMTFRVTEFD